MADLDLDRERKLHENCFLGDGSCGVWMKNDGEDEKCRAIQLIDEIDAAVEAQREKDASVDPGQVNCTHHACGATPSEFCLDYSREAMNTFHDNRWRAAIRAGGE